MSQREGAAAVGLHHEATVLQQAIVRPWVEASIGAGVACTLESVRCALSASSRGRCPARLCGCTSSLTPYPGAGGKAMEDSEDWVREASVRSVRAVELPGPAGTERRAGVTSLR